MIVRQMTSCLVALAFSSLARILGECWTVISLPALFLIFFFYKVDISSRTLIPLIMPKSVHSGSAS